MGLLGHAFQLLDSYIPDCMLKYNWDADLPVAWDNAMLLLEIGQYLLSVQHRVFILPLGWIP